MHKMTRAAAIEAIKSAGVAGDHQAFTRLYVKNRISLQVARDAFNDGRRFATYIEARDRAIENEKSDRK